MASPLTEYQASLWIASVEKMASEITKLGLALSEWRAKLVGKREILDPAIKNCDAIKSHLNFLKDKLTVLSTPEPP